MTTAAELHEAMSATLSGRATPLVHSSAPPLLHSSTRPLLSSTRVVSVTETHPTVDECTPLLIGVLKNMYARNLQLEAGASTRPILCST
jgi:hypothetical protein